MQPETLVRGEGTQHADNLKQKTLKTPTKCTLFFRLLVNNGGKPEREGYEKILDKIRLKHKERFDEEWGKNRKKIKKNKLE